ncbi:hypothetical protein, partial [Acuticoccus yangtzensis]
EGETLRSGQSVRLNEALTVVEAMGFEQVGDLYSLREIISRPGEDGSAGRGLVVGHSDEERVVWLAAPLFELGQEEGTSPLKSGDSVMVDSRAG